MACNYTTYSFILCINFQYIHLLEFFDLPHLTAYLLRGKSPFNWMIPWLSFLLMDLFILTQTQLDRAHKFIPVFAECHSKNSQNFSITQLSFHKAPSISYLSISMTFVIQEDSGSPGADNFSYIYQASAKCCLCDCCIDCIPLCHLSSRSLLQSRSELEKHILDSK